MTSRAPARTVERAAGAAAGGSAIPSNLPGMTGKPRFTLNFA
jgi:hypothetical protein